jgi:hypothetical protein
MISLDKDPNSLNNNRNNNQRMLCNVLTNNHKQAEKESWFTKQAATSMRQQR